MNPEQFHNAMNYLDDDLIEQTDRLRQGRRVLHGRRIIRWIASAACLALVLGVAAAPRMMTKAENGAADMFVSNEMEMTPGKPFQDSLQSEAEKSNYESSTDWQRVSHGDISLEIPGTWTYRVEETADSYYIAIRPHEVSGELKIGCDPSFGVCGTGLTEAQTTIAGMKANVGYFDGGTHWDFITFRVANQKYVVLKDGAESWWNVNEDTVNRILETLIIEE